MKKIAAGIVLYNPDLTVLNENIDSIVNQVDYIVMVDNNSKDNLIEDIKERYKEYKNFYYIVNYENLGISGALNQIIEFCSKKDIEWVLTLDQDSICPLNLIKTYKRYTEMPDVAIITPAITDRNLINEGEKSTKKYIFVDRCLTSAALTNVRICKEVKCFDEKMFIDFVDFDYCYTLKENGYKIIKTYEVNLLHQLGDLEVYTILNKKIFVSNHNSLRKYYYLRNAIYCYKKHKKLMGLNILLRIIGKIYIKTIIFEDDKLKKIISMNKGIVDGIRM